MLKDLGELHIGIADISDVTSMMPATCKLVGYALIRWYKEALASD